MPLVNVLSSFLPVGDRRLTAAELPERCTNGVHTWLDPERSLRSARTGYTRSYCRFCMVTFTLVADAPRPHPTRAWQPASAPALLSTRGALTR